MRKRKREKGRNKERKGERMQRFIKGEKGLDGLKVNNSQ
jgi:hypothetical protein